MTEKKPLTEGYQPLQKGYQPKPVPQTVPPGDKKVRDGYQPATGAKPAPKPPPKKP
jgi:hypothetical protein